MKNTKILTAITFLISAGLTFTAACSDDLTTAATPLDSDPADTSISDTDSTIDSELPLDSETGTEVLEYIPQDIDASIHANQVAYDSNYPKQAVVQSEKPIEMFRIIDADTEKTVYTGRLQQVDNFDEWGGGSNFGVARFDSLNRQGTYIIESGNGRSAPFKIGIHRQFKETIKSLLYFFNESRADDADVWSVDKTVPFYGSTQTHDVRGGWYDASGDISKYLSHLSYANFMNPQQIPLTAWSLAWVSDKAGDLLKQEGLQKDFQDEALFGADYLLRVLDPEGFFYINVFDDWTGNLSARKICAYEYEGDKTTDWQAAYREGGGMSIAALARISAWGIDSSSFTSAQYLDGAEKGFDHLENSNSLYTDDGVDNIIDDYTALMAASELYAATDNKKYLDAARIRAASLENRLTDEGYFLAGKDNRPFWHASDAGLPVMALLRYKEIEPDAVQQNNAGDVITAHLEYLESVTGSVANPYGYARQNFLFAGNLRSGFFIPHDNETGYWWQGENARLASLATAALLAGNNTSQKLYAQNQLNWILGANPYDICFMRGYGVKNPPDYCYTKKQHGDLKGGISNGITGAGTDGSGIRWITESSGCSEDWRHAEQWLPHSTWFLMAVTAMAVK